jgi:FkbM family methyltransferase
LVGWGGDPTRHAIYADEYERPERAILAASLSANDVYLEVGAGLGLLATLAGRRVSSGTVVALEANPVMAQVSRETTARNGVTADIRNLVLAPTPSSATATFYIRSDFRASSLTQERGAREISVPVVDAHETIQSVGATYLMVDVEGAETDLLQMSLPRCVAAVCVETHSRVTGPVAQTAMVSKLIADGFTLEIDRCIPPVLLFSRYA